jgi:hypothetical protein
MVNVALVIRMPAAKYFQIYTAMKGVVNVAALIFTRMHRQVIVLTARRIVLLMAQM